MLWFKTHRNKLNCTGYKNINNPLTLSSLKLEMLNLNFKL